MRLVPGSPTAQFIETLPLDDPRRYGFPLNGPRQLGILPPPGPRGDLDLSGGVPTQLGEPIAPGTVIPQTQTPRPRRPFGGFGYGPQNITPKPFTPSAGALAQAQSQYGQYGFSDELINYLARNIQAGYIDGGANINYDPATQQFTVGPRRPGIPGFDNPDTYSLEEFQNKFLSNSTTTPTIQPRRQRPFPFRPFNPYGSPMGYPYNMNPFGGFGGQQSMSPFMGGFGGYNPYQQSFGGFGGYNPYQQFFGGFGGYNPYQQSFGGFGGYSPYQQSFGGFGGYSPYQQSFNTFNPFGSMQQTQQQTQQQPQQPTPLQQQQVSQGYNYGGRGFGMTPGSYGIF